MAAMQDLEALLSDLQHTTEVLRRANLGDRYSQSREDLEPIYQEQTRREQTSCAAPFRKEEFGAGAGPGPGRAGPGRGRGRAGPGPGPGWAMYASYNNHDLDNIEQMVNSYSEEREKRKSYDDVRPSRVNDGGGDRPSVHSLFNQLDEIPQASSRRSLGAPSQAQSYNDVRGARSPSRDLSHADSMIGTLNNGELSSRYGVNTIPKGDCAHCGKPIVGQVVIAMGKMWHPEHYVCCECGCELGHKNFFERNGRAYCEDDYHNQFSPKCAGCSGPIKDRCVTALNRNYHLQCFCCSQCGRELGDTGFHEKNGQVYCREDFFKLFAPKCTGCQSPIKSNFITALGTHWHPDCFVCQMCGVHFDGGSFFDHNGMPLCEQHYHEKRGSICHVCRAPISGRCVSAMGQKYHPEHFKCTYCSRTLTKGTFKEVDRRPFCHKCYNQTFALTPDYRQ